jgi:hypothetical protein
MQKRRDPERRARTNTAAKLPLEDSAVGQAFDIGTYRQIKELQLCLNPAAHEETAR